MNQNLKMYALHDVGNFDAAETCLCEDHFNDANKAKAVLLSRKSFDDLLKSTGSAKFVFESEVKNLTYWREVEKWPNFECIICSRTKTGACRLSDTDYSPYEE